LNEWGWGVWITGLPASGKSTITDLLVKKLEREGVYVQVLESDELRKILTPTPSYTLDERENFYKAMVYIGTLLAKNGVNVIFDATANRRRWRQAARENIPLFAEVYLSCPLGVCISRDPKGIYCKARKGEAENVPGAQVEYEESDNPEVVLSCLVPPSSSVDKILKEIRDRGFL
jgi:adenylylsulfate kinase